jgi:N-acetylmuramoyl-L-alanine amidase
MSTLSGKEKPVVFLDCGHGPGDSTPSRMFLHEDGWVSEGDINRVLGDIIASRLRQHGVRVVFVSDRWSDTPLEDRVGRANKLWKALGHPRSLFFSIHANGSVTHTATGTEGFTFVGVTEADTIFAKIWMLLVDKFYDRIKFRAGWVGGGPDKEEKFYVLKNTAMPAILWEFFFYDNPHDLDKYYWDEPFRNDFSNTTADGIASALKDQV